MLGCECVNQKLWFLGVFLAGGGGGDPSSMGKGRLPTSLPTVPFLLRLMRLTMIIIQIRHPVGFQLLKTCLTTLKLAQGESIHVAFIIIYALGFLLTNAYRNAQRVS